LIISYRRAKFKTRSWKFNGALARQIFASSWLMMLTTASVLVYMKIDQVIIRHMLDERAVGLYSAAIKLSEVWYFIPGIICVSLFPAIINSKKTNQESYYSRLKNLFLLVLALSLIIAIIVSVLARPIVYVLFGEDYLESVSVLSIYAWSIVGMFLGMVAGYYLLAENYMKIYFFSSFFVAGLNIVLNVLLIPRMGINGAAVATVVSYSFLVLGLLFFRKTRRELRLVFRR
jgi:O-antigen/teichoic acid export membrane protein